jgi:hypothetical protein
MPSIIFAFPRAANKPRASCLIICIEANEILLQSDDSRLKFHDFYEQRQATESQLNSDDSRYSKSASQELCRRLELL